MGHKWTT